MDKQLEKIRMERERARIEYEQLMALLDQNEAEVTVRLAISEFATHGPFSARLRSDLVDGSVYGIIRLNSDMYRLKGTAVTVIDVQGDIMQIEESEYYFATEMLDGATIGERE